VESLVAVIVGERGVQFPPVKLVAPLTKYSTPGNELHARHKLLSWMAEEMMTIGRPDWVHWVALIA
jgi:hypothetical protein